MSTPDMNAARVRLDSWRFWMVISYIGLAILMGCVYHLFSARASDEADRRASAKVANAAQVTDCVASYRAAPNVLKLLDFLDVLADNSIQANRAALEADPTGQLTQVRKDSLKRLTPAVPAIDVFRQSTIQGQRTLADCRELARKLDVQIEPLLKTKGER